MGRPRKKFYQKCYDKTLVRWDLPRDVEKGKGFILQNAEGKMEEKDLRKRTQFFAVLLEQLTRATTLLWNGTGLDLMFVYSGISYLATTTGGYNNPLEGGPSLKGSM